MNYIDLEGEDPMRFGIEVSMTGSYQLRTATEGADYMTREYSYVEMLEPFAMFVNGHQVQLPKELIDKIEESLISYLD
jgi:dihydroneopterin aldolase